MKKPMTKTAAIKYAKTQVSELYRFGDGWKYNYYDASCQAWRESGPNAYSIASAHRSHELVRVACQAMGMTQDAINMRVFALSDWGGKWVDQLD